MESFNGRMRDELHNESLYFGLEHSRQKLGAWTTNHKTRRQHSSIGYQTRVAYAATLAQQADLLRAAARPVAQPAPYGVTTAVTLVAAG